MLQGFGEKLDDDDFKEFIKSVPVQTDGNINNNGKEFNSFTIFYQFLEFTS